VSLGKVAKVIDGFEENRKILRFNGKPCLLVEALRLNDENALEIAAKVKKYAATARERFPEGITLHIWDDSSLELEGPARHLVDQPAPGQPAGAHRARVCSCGRASPFG
jgi:multidrug efflux pump subunit AcrB